MTFRRYGVYLIVAIQLSTTTAWIGSEIGRKRRIMRIGGIQEIPSTSTSLADQSPKAGSFFNPIPEDSGDSKKEDDDEQIVNIDDQIQEILRLNQQLRIKNDRPSSATRLEKSGGGFAPPSKQLHTPKNQKPFVGIGPPLNDVTKPEYDANGYTLYADERTGVKSRVFEALIDYPCLFTLKIVGSDTIIGNAGNEKLKANSGDSEIQNSSFVNDILAIVAESCEVEYVGPETLEHSLRTNGKWTSITVKAPVKSAEMLYQLYEQVDRDPRVKFKF